MNQKQSAAETLLALATAGAVVATIAFLAAAGWSAWAAALAASIWTVVLLLGAAASYGSTHRK